MKHEKKKRKVVLKPEPQTAKLGLQMLGDQLAEKPKISVKELRAQAQELIRTGKMPTPEQFAQAMNEARADYVPKLKKLRKRS